MKTKGLISKKIILITLIAFWGASTPLLAWGPIGHYIVGELAEKHLTKRAQENLKKILGSESLAEVSVWPDEIKSDKNWNHTHAWHYVSIPDNKHYHETKASKKGDVIQAIKRFEKEVCNLKLERQKRYRAVKFLTHFIADVHQPLHVGRKEDRGGNTINLKWFGKKRNLHQVWDSEMIEMQRLSFTEYVRFINHPSKTDVNSWQKHTLMDWVKESQKLRPQVYEFEQKKKYWEYRYLYDNKKDMNRRLTQAGIRLAGVLNRCLK